MIEVRVALANTIRGLRERHELSQEQVAELLESGQARVSKVESADPSISLDFMVRAAFCLGATRGDLARAISPIDSQPAIGWLRKPEWMTIVAEPISPF